MSWHKSHNQRSISKYTGASAAPGIESASGEAQRLRMDLTMDVANRSMTDDTRLAGGC
jgi:hypothetical protein